MDSNRDWTGNSKSTFGSLGASNHTEKDREVHDFYATSPKAIDALLSKEELPKNIWECACGGGHLSEVLEKYGYSVTSTDLVDRGYGVGGVDFLKQAAMFDGDIVTNPPYKYAKEFIEKALKLIPSGNKVAMFLKVQFLEGKARKKLFSEHPPKIIYVSSSRLLCAKNAVCSSSFYCHPFPSSAWLAR